MEAILGAAQAAANAIMRAMVIVLDGSQIAGGIGDEVASSRKPATFPLRERQMAPRRSAHLARQPPDRISE